MYDCVHFETYNLQIRKEYSEDDRDNISWYNINLGHSS